MTTFSDRFRVRKPVEILSREDKTAIHEAALEVMETVGIRIHSRSARDALRNAGALVDEATAVVKFPRHVTDSLMASVPEEIVLAGREKEYDLPMDGRHCFYTTDGCGISVWEQETQSRRLAVLQDIRDSARMADYLPHCSIYEPTVVPSDVPEESHVIVAMKEAFDISRKHILSESTSNPEEARTQVQMASEIVGGIDELRKRHIMSAMVCTMSPLTLDGNATEAGMVWADAHVPVCITGMAMAGVSSPATLAGNIVVNHAETLSLACALQARSKGAPAMYGSVLSNVDPRSGAILLASPEGILLCILAHEMAKHVKMPSACGGLGSNAKVPGMQSCIENSLVALGSTLFAQEVNNGLGLLDCSTVLSYEQMVIDNDIVGRALVFGREIPVTKETLHLDLIKEVGILGMGKKKGNFLGERATMQEVRQFFRSDVLASEPFDQWVAKGRKSEVAAAKERADWILKNHQPEMLDKDVSARLAKIVEAAAK